MNALFSVSVVIIRCHFQFAPKNLEKSLEKLPKKVSYRLIIYKAEFVKNMTNKCC